MDSINKKIWRRIFVTLIISFIYILGMRIPLPGFYTDNFELNNFIILLSGYSKSGTLFSLGIGPWMTASIFSYFFHIFKSDNSQTTKKSTEKKTLILALVIAFIQALLIALNIKANITLKIINLVLIFGGVVLVIFMGNYNKKYGIGSQTIFIILNIFISYKTLIIDQINAGAFSDFAIDVSLVIVFAVLFMVISYVDLVELRIPIFKLMVNSRFKDKEYIPIKFNCTGITPIMFSGIFFMLAAYLILIVCNFFGWESSSILEMLFSMNTYISVIIFSAIILCITVLFAFIIINPHKISKDLMKNNDYIIGIKPGLDTENYLNKVILKMSFVNALFYVVFLCGPMFLGICFNWGNLFCTNISTYFFLIGLLQSFMREFMYVLNIRKYKRDSLKFLYEKFRYRHEIFSIIRHKQ